MPSPPDEHWHQQFWSGITETFMQAIHEDSSLARDTFALTHRLRRLPETPLMHLMCRLDCDLSLVKDVYEVAGPESLRVRTSVLAQNDGSLPIHEACCHSASIALIQFLIEQYPESMRMRCNEKLHCSLIWTSPRGE